MISKHYLDFMMGKIEMMRVSYGGYSETRLPANPEDLLLNPSPWIVGSGVVFSFSTNKANRQPARKPTDFHRLSHATTSAYRTHQFMKMMYAILKSGGKMICSDFHPYRGMLQKYHSGAYCKVKGGRKRNSAGTDCGRIQRVPVLG